MKIRNKKGMSALIETVLIIGFTIVLAAMIIGWGGKLFKGMQSDTQKTAEFSRMCTNADVDFKAVQIYNTADPIQATGTTITAENNAQTPIEGFLVIAKRVDGTTTSFLAGSSAMNTANTQLSLNVPAPILGTTSLGAFGKAQYTLDDIVAVASTATTPVTTTANLVNGIDIRPVVKTVTGDYHVCENEQTITILAA